MQTELSMMRLETERLVMGLDRLYAKADPGNKASLRILEKLGFVFDRVLEGLKGDYEDCNGERMHVLTKVRFGERKVI